MLGRVDTSCGTLLRIPLRDTFDSKINKNENIIKLNLKELKNKLLEFSMSAKECLIFLKKLNSIKISFIEKDGTFQEVTSVYAAMSEADKLTKESFEKSLGNIEAVGGKCSYDMEIVSKIQRSSTPDISEPEYYKISWSSAPSELNQIV